MCSSRAVSPWSPPFWCLGPRPGEARCWGLEGRHWGQWEAQRGWDQVLGALCQPGALAWPESSEVRWPWRQQRGPLGGGGPKACWRDPKSGGEPGCGRFWPGSGWRPLGVGLLDRAHAPLPFGRRPPTCHTGAGYSSHLGQRSRGGERRGSANVPPLVIPPSPCWLRVSPQDGQ